MFQHTAARRRLAQVKGRASRKICVSTHSRPKAAGRLIDVHLRGLIVSTHSRPKAAGRKRRLTVQPLQFQHTAARRRLAGSLGAGFPTFGSFNTQPPEGGWAWRAQEKDATAKFQHTAARRRLGLVTGYGEGENRFQHTAARRRLAVKPPCFAVLPQVSTHSRPKAAGASHQMRLTKKLSFNTQPPEGGWRHTICAVLIYPLVSTHSRPKAAGKRGMRRRLRLNCFNTQPPEGGWVEQPTDQPCRIDVSTHSRPKAAGAFSILYPCRRSCFNTQPPEGGWLPHKQNKHGFPQFQHTAARRRLG